MTLLVKICGITGTAAADAAVRAGADFTGLVWHPKSPRHLAAEQAASLAAHLRGRVRLVAMLVDPADETVEAVLKTMRPDLLQLHGKETPTRVGALRTRFGIPIIKVLPIAEASDFASVPAYEDAADMLMFDAKPPSGAAREGGLGAAFDWQLMQGRRFAKPWLLAGGLTAENVARAIRLTGAPGVDVSSGVETAPGVKSPARIAEFTAAAKAARYASETRA